MALQEQMTMKSSVSSEWKRWIAENKMLKVEDRQILNVLTQNGIDEGSALEELRAVAAHPYFQAGDWIAQRLRKLESLLDVYRELSALSGRFGNIERRINVSRDEFLESYYSANRPVILLGLMQNWKALSSWNSDYLKATCGNATVEVMTGRSSDPRYEINLERHRRQMPFSEYIDMVARGGETNDYYMVANNHFLEKEETKPLLGDIEMFPEYLNPDIWSGRVFFWFGPPGTVTPLHHDTANIFMAQVSGRKGVILISSHQAHLVYNYLGVHSEVDCEMPDYKKYPLFKDVDRIEIVLQPGEVLFLPVGWWHHVRALDVSITVSFMNFAFPNEYHWFSPEIRR